MWKQILKDCGLGRDQIERIPILPFGRMEFKDDRARTPHQITPIGPWGDSWLKEIWAKVVVTAPEGLPLFLLFAVQFHNNQNISPGLKQSGPDPSLIRVTNSSWGLIGSALALGAIAVGVGLAGVTGGASLATILGGIAVLLGGLGGAKASNDVRQIRKHFEQRRREAESEERRTQQEAAHNRRASVQAYHRSYSPDEALSYLEGLELIPLVKDEDEERLHIGDLTRLVPAKPQMLSSIASIKEKLRRMDPNEKVSIPLLVEEEMDELAQKKVLKLLLGGPAGSGKSTQANTRAYYADYSPAQAVAYLEEFERKITSVADGHPRRE